MYTWRLLIRKHLGAVDQWFILPFGLLLCVMGLTGAGSSSMLSSFSAGSCPDSVFTLEEEVGLGERKDWAFGFFAGDVLWADGQSCWFRHTEHRGLTGRQTCCPKPTSSQLISLHSSLQQTVRGTSEADFIWQKWPKYFISISYDYSEYFSPSEQSGVLAALHVRDVLSVVQLLCMDVCSDSTALMAILPAKHDISRLSAALLLLS